jgi:hypothetical protein
MRIYTMKKIDAAKRQKLRLNKSKIRRVDHCRWTPVTFDKMIAIMKITGLIEHQSSLTR